MTVAWVPREAARWGKSPLAVEAPPGNKQDTRLPGPAGRITPPSSCRRCRPCEAAFPCPMSPDAGSAGIALLWGSRIGARTRTAGALVEGRGRQEEIGRAHG